MNKAIFYSLLVWASTPCFADLLGENAFDLINISADTAIEGDQPGIMHLSGNFRMLSEQWLLTSSKATVYGSPNRPDKIVLEGEPARFVFLPAKNSNKETIDAVAYEVEYLREESLLRLKGEASLVLGGETIRSKFIEYDITTNRYRAGGDNGVKIQVPPVNQ